MNKMGNAKMCSIYYLLDGLAIPFKFQTPRMSTPFELKTPNYGDEAKKNFKQFSMSFAGEDASEELQQFRKFLYKVDERVLDILSEKHIEWFGKQRKPVNRDYLEHQYGYLIKDGSNHKKLVKYPDRMNVKIKIYSGVLQAAFFDEDNEIMTDESSISMAHNEAIAIIQFPSIWISSGYYPMLEAKQVQIFILEGMDTVYGIVDENGSDTEVPEEESMDILNGI